MDPEGSALNESKGFKDIWMHCTAILLKEMSRMETAQMLLPSWEERVALHSLGRRRRPLVTSWWQYSRL